MRNTGFHTDTENHTTFHVSNGHLALTINEIYRIIQCIFWQVSIISLSAREVHASPVNAFRLSNHLQVGVRIVRIFMGKLT